ncbi:MAG: hypothetical protein KC503_17860 [Myxococcales bacterium]|nr:hypothetical protein [Myxococcales bacterium]
MATAVGSNRKSGVWIPTLVALAVVATTTLAAPSSTHAEGWRARALQRVGRTLGQLGLRGRGVKARLANTSAERRALQSMLAPRVYDPKLDKTIVAMPSMTMDPQEIKKIKGAGHYTERQLYNLLFLRDPKARVAFISPVPVDKAVVDYYKRLAGNPKDADKRLLMVSTNGGHDTPLSHQLLRDRNALKQLSSFIGKQQRQAHLYPFTVTDAEWKVAEKLGIPLLGPYVDAAKQWGTKAGNKIIFRRARVPHPRGSREVRTVDKMVDAIDKLITRTKGRVSRFMVKLNDGFSGEGNAIFDVKSVASLRGRARRQGIRAGLERMNFMADGETWARYSQQIPKLGAIVEPYIDWKTSPSVQGYINPNGKVEVLSTHEQVLGGKGQVYMGATFPANKAYRAAMHRYAHKVGRQLAREGVIGRFALDFIATPRANEAQWSNPTARKRLERSGRWDLYAVEINLRQGGTTHPVNTLKLLTGGAYDEKHGVLRDPQGRAKYLQATDNHVDNGLLGKSPAHAIEALRKAGLEYDSGRHAGVVLHLMGAMNQYGKVGFTAIGDSPREAKALFVRAEKVLREMAAQK